MLHFAYKVHLNFTDVKKLKLVLYFLNEKMNYLRCVNQCDGDFLEEPLDGAIFY